MRVRFLIIALILIIPAVNAQNLDSLLSVLIQKQNSLEYQAGKIEISDGLAELNLSSNFRFLNSTNAAIVLEEIWGNPEDHSILGMIVPVDFNSLSDSTWGMVITYSADGYVSDEDADKIDYDELLENMQKDAASENSARIENGYEPIDFVGWAEPPYYDKASHKLYWAQELKFGDAEINTLNYNIRILGRKGVLILNTVSSITLLENLREDMNSVLASVEFKEGNRYTDFNPDMDELAGYGIAALIGGKVLAKAGFFKIILGFLLAAKKFVIMAIVGIGAFIKKLFFSEKAGSDSKIHEDK